MCVRISVQHGNKRLCRNRSLTESKNRISKQAVLRKNYKLRDALETRRMNPDFEERDHFLFLLVRWEKKRIRT